MAAPMINKRESLGKIIFEKSSFKHPKSKHEDVIAEHYFNSSISCILPENAKGKEIEDCCHRQKSFMAFDLPVSELIETDFIGAFVRAGQMYMLSHNTHIDMHDCVAILPNGHLILHITKDTYETLGLEGKSSLFPQKNSLKFVIDIDLLDKNFLPGGKKYERVAWCIKNRFQHRQFNFFTTWNADDDHVCPSSVQQYFIAKGYRCDLLPVTGKRKHYNNINMPDLCGSAADLKDVGHEELFEWLGCVSVGADLPVDVEEYVSTYSYAGNTKTGSCMNIQCKGFFTCSTVQTVMDHLRKLQHENNLPWCSLTVHGYMDSPTSWSRYEHNFFYSGDNLLTIVLFPDDVYWCYKAISTYDFVT